MPVSLLWAVDVYGRVYSLSTAGQQWEQCRDVLMEFKRVTAAQQCCWGIACDNNIYLNVHASDLPVRYQEETYENQVGLFNQCHCLYLEKNVLKEDAYSSQGYTQKKEALSKNAFTFFCGNHLFPAQSVLSKIENVQFPLDWGFV